jgi:hypothetical protein
MPDGFAGSGARKGVLASDAGEAACCLFEPFLGRGESVVFRLLLGAVSARTTISMISTPATAPNIAHIYGGNEDQKDAVTVKDPVLGPTCTI